MRLIYKILKNSNKQIDTILMATDIIIHDQKDNVGVVVIEKITPKQDCKCWIMENDSSVNIQSADEIPFCLLYTSPSPRDMRRSRMPSSA